MSNITKINKVSMCPRCECDIEHFINSWESNHNVICTKCNDEVSEDAAWFEDLTEEEIKEFVAEDEIRLEKIREENRKKREKKND